MRRAGLVLVLVLGFAMLVGPLAATAAAGEPAHACISESFRLLSPSSDEAAPRNAHVRVAFSDGWRVPVRVVLRARGRAVPAASREVSVGQTRVVDVVPLEPLDTHVTYEVMAIERGAAMTRTVVGEFRVGDELASSWMQWTGWLRLVLAHPASGCADGWR